LAWWLVGLGIAPIFNRRACPTQNAQVERCHGLIGSGGDPEHCPDFARWQQQVAWVVKTQREQ
jgi:transposase InsO family protein